MLEEGTFTVAVRRMGDAGWEAGTVYLAGLLGAARAADASLRTILLLARGEDERPDLRRVCDATLRLPSPSVFTPRGLVGRAMKLLLQRDPAADRLLAANGVDLVAFDGGLRTALPTLAWLPDFQHRSLPEMFSPREVRSRTCAFRRVLRRATRVLLISEAVLADVTAFAPRLAGKCRVIRPVCDLPAGIAALDARDAVRRHGLPEKFVLMPGQLWRHKDHLSAFEAVRLLRGEGIPVTLVCCGRPEDRRHPGHAAALGRFLDAHDLRSQVRLLGFIPRPDLYALMRQSIAVLTASRYEGFGMAVDEGASLGKRLVLTDITPHREQRPPEARFFPPGDARELAGVLGRIWRETAPGVDGARERQALRDHARRREEYGRSVLGLLRETAGR